MAFENKSTAMLLFKNLNSYGWRLYYTKRRRNFVLNYMKKLLLILSIFISSCCLICQGSNVKISGKVIDAEDKPIEFATVRIAGTAVGTNTDLQGMYSLSVASQDTINVIFSCIGFKEVKRQLLDPEGEVTLNVRMYTDSQLLDELEVVGFQGNSN